MSRGLVTIHRVIANNAYLADLDIEVDMVVAIDHSTGDVIDGDVSEVCLRQRVSDCGWDWRSEGDIPL